MPTPDPAHPILIHLRGAERMDRNIPGAITARQGWFRSPGSRAPVMPATIDVCFRSPDSLIYSGPMHLQYTAHLPDAQVTVGIYGAPKNPFTPDGGFILVGALHDSKHSGTCPWLTHATLAETEEALRLCQQESLRSRFTIPARPA